MRRDAIALITPVFRESVRTTEHRAWNQLELFALPA